MLLRERHYLLDMLNAAKLAQDFVADIDREVFASDLMRQAAVTRQIEIIGEAAQRISAESRSTIPNIPWDEIIEMRNRLIYEYDNIDITALWENIQITLPELITLLERSLRS